jgi:hypothetical protein
MTLATTDVVGSASWRPGDVVGTDTWRAGDAVENASVDAIAATSLTSSDLRGMPIW